MCPLHLTWSPAYWFSQTLNWKSDFETTTTALFGLKQAAIEGGGVWNIDAQGNEAQNEIQRRMWIKEL